MTDEGEKWLDEIGINRSTADAEKAIRAFCDEVEKRAKKVISCDQDECIATAFDKLKRELLGP